MPNYDLKCEKCGFQFERTLKMADPNPECPNIPPVADGTPAPKGTATCGGPTQKIITGGTFHLKGKGWASDGYSG